MQLTYSAFKRPVFSAMWLLWIAITVLFLYERTYLIQKAGLPYFVQCAVIRVGLLLLLCQIHLRVLVAGFLAHRRFLAYGVLTALSIVAYLLLQGAYDRYLFGFVIGDQQRQGWLSNTPYNTVSTIWYLLITYLIQRGMTLAVRPQITTPPPTVSSDIVLDAFNIKTGTTHVRLPFAAVTYAKGLKDYTLIHTETNRYVMKGSIGKIADVLPADQFVRIHKSYIIAQCFIDGVTRQRVIVAGKSIPVGRAYANKLQQLGFTGRKF
ncbi:LytR/AlgR family response regulator transcription factor [Spirosoma montaniterrae]|uniref:HTH LytTR-type domain-containing protein n=1 Tax=Spirosoma montaniterrae TaxID=1178516 RepID=A0A1P9WV51_9BACT|nr:LytTR family DNA-binding domain-containing protein [Spirosoma montaniterrae]AQG79276.1 hypothetical protein AWR27_08015 [Spirosoma montaniterrae]